MELRGSQTEKNLRAALQGESIARNKYTYFADQAKEEGKMDIAEFFERLAKNEQEHARLWYKLLFGEPKETIENLKLAAEGEHEEWTDMYARFADEAKAEGFGDIAKLFSEVRRIERNHERENLSLLTKLKNHEATKLEAEKNLWVCGYCGFTMETSDKIDKCLLCKHDVIGL